MFKLSQDQEARLKSLRDDIVVQAKKLGKSVEEHAADQIADMRTDALDSIFRAAIVSAALGVILGMYLGFVFFK